MALPDDSLRSIRAAGDLLLGRPEAMRQFDLSVRGFWFSFVGFLFCLPANLLLMAADRRIAIESGADVASLGRGAAIELLDMALDWSVFPLFLALIARPLGIGRGFVGFIIVRNWAAVILAGLSAVSVLPYLAGILGLDFTLILNVLVLGISLQFTYRIARVTLGVPIMMAIGLVVLDFLITLLIDIAMAGLAAAG